MLKRSDWSERDIFASTLGEGKFPARYGLRQFEMSWLRLMVWKAAGFV